MSPLRPEASSLGQLVPQSRIVNTQLSRYPQLQISNFQHCSWIVLGLECMNMFWLWGEICIFKCHHKTKIFTHTLNNLEVFTVYCSVWRCATWHVTGSIIISVTIHNGAAAAASEIWVFLPPSPPPTILLSSDNRTKCSLSLTLIV